MRPAMLACLLLSPIAMASPAIDARLPRAFVHDLKAGAVAEECLRLEAGRSRSFEWSSDGPVDFNIHYHRGNDVTYPVKVDGQRRGRGRFTAKVTEDYCWMWTARDATKVTGKLGPDE